MTEKKKLTIPGVRYLFAINCMLGLCMVYGLRSNINVAIVAMVNNTAIYNDTHHNGTQSSECILNGIHSSTNGSADIQQDGPFVWSPSVQGHILGSFYYGYVVSQIFGGRLAELFSGKWVFAAGTVFTALLNLLTPAAARTGIGCVIAVRVLEGLSQGMTTPALSHMLGRWLPDSEKGFLYTLVHAGSNIGTLLTMSVTGYLCESDLFGGWSSSFYVAGTIGFIWFIVWCILVTDTPATHPLISKNELKYITCNQKIDIRGKLPPLPWRRVLVSLPFWTLVLTQTCQDWSYYTLTTDLPTYFASILHFRISVNGFLSSLPHFLQSVVGLMVALVADFVIRRQLATVKFVRKFCNSISGFGAAMGLVCVCLSGCNVTANVVFFVFAIAVGGFCYSGHELTLLDLSPEYAGTLTGIASTITNMTGFLAPLYVGYLTDKKQTLEQWRYVFGTTSCLLTFASVFFVFFSTTEKHNWNKDEDVHDVPATDRKKYMSIND